MARHQNINTTLIYAHNIDRIANAVEFKIDHILREEGLGSVLKIGVDNVKRHNSNLTILSIAPKLWKFYVHKTCILNVGIGCHRESS